MVHPLHDAHLHAEARKDLGQLGPDGATSEDQERLGEPLDLDRLPVCPVRDIGQARNRWNRGRRSGTDHDRAPRLKRPAINRDLAWSGEPARAANKTTTLLLEALDRDAVIPVIGRDLADAAGDRAPIRPDC